VREVLATTTDNSPVDCTQLEPATNVAPELADRVTTPLGVCVPVSPRIVKLGRQKPLRISSGMSVPRETEMALLSQGNGVLCPITLGLSKLAPRICNGIASPT